MFPLDVTLPIVATVPVCGNVLNLKPDVDPSHTSKSFLSLIFTIEVDPR